MKLDRLSSAKLKVEIKKAFQSSGLTYAGLGAVANVHPSQVSRICRGEFRTLSHNVVQVCAGLGLQTNTDPAALKSTVLEKQLEQRLHKIWKQKPILGRRLLRLLGSIETLKPD